METIGARLKFARKERKLEQDGLAKLAGVTQGTVGNIEAGLRSGLPSLPLLAEALRVRYRWLRFGEGEMELEKTAWPLSRELLDAARQADATAVWKAENAARNVLDMEPLPRPLPEKQQPLAA